MVIKAIRGTSAHFGHVPNTHKAINYHVIGVCAHGKEANIKVWMHFAPPHKGVEDQACYSEKDLCIIW